MKQVVRVYVAGPYTKPDPVSNTRMPGESNGADKECELARSLGIPVVTTYEDLKARFPLAS